MLGLNKLRDKLVHTVTNAQETIYKATLVLLTVTALLWMSIFLYATFYYSYIPPVSHTRPVYLQFSRSCDRASRTMCTFPSANVTLTKREQFLMVGQPYKILLELEVPESPANRNLGMFMTCARLQNKDGDTVEESCRPALIQYKSSLLQLISTVVFYPLVLAGSYEEKQMLAIELFSNFQEDPYNPVTAAELEIQSFSIEVYQVSLKIHAHFTGLRHLMFHWPLTAAVMGVSTNLFFLSVIAFLSWFKFFKPSQPTVHVGYDTVLSKTAEVRHSVSKERVMSSHALPQVAVPEAVKPMTSKEELELDYDHQGDGDVPKIIDDYLDLDVGNDDDQVVPEGVKICSSSSSEADTSERKTSSEFEVVDNSSAEEGVDKGQGDVDLRRRKHSK